jgi:hypothetical protein
MKSRCPRELVGLAVFAHANPFEYGINSTFHASKSSRIGIGDKFSPENFGYQAAGNRDNPLRMQST